jgi:WD40 repeat protein
MGADPVPVAHRDRRREYGCVGNRSEGAPQRCPYQGLAPFTAENSDLFFGRARATRALIERLGRRLDGPGAILMVTGASGVGKSSLLRAGVLPALANGMLPVAGSTRWPRLLITPTARPLDALAACLAGAYGEDNGENEDGGGGDRPVLIVDQFEELFTLVAAEEERQAFVGALHSLADEPRGAAVIIGVRADYWDRCAAYPQFAEAIQDGQVIVEPMTESDLRLAITGPAAAAGLDIEPGLVETILGDLRAGRDTADPYAADRYVGDRYAAGTLPLLSQSLRNTWQRRQNGRLTIRGYEESGRVRDAVHNTAEEVFQGLSAEDRMTALRVFRRLTLITAGGRVARRPATLTEIHAAVSTDPANPADSAASAASANPANPANPADRRDRVDALISAFADRRLLTLHEDTAEISHDALLTAWPALRRWLAPDLTAQAVYDRLIEDATQWDENHRDPAFLYRGARLLSVRETRPRWDRDPDSFPPPGPTVDGFVAASAREARRTERRRRLTMAGLAALLVVALIAAGAAINAARDADHERTLAEARQLAAQSQVVGDTDPVTAALLAVASWRIAPTQEARYSMLSAAGRPSRGVLSGHKAPVTALAFSPAGSVIATGAVDGTARLWDVATRRQLGAPIVHPPADGGTNIDAVAFDPAANPAGRVLATAQLTTVRFWDASTHRQLGVPLHTEDPIPAMAFSPDGKTLATTSSQGSIQLWDVNARRQRGDAIRASDAKEELERPINKVAFSPDGRRLATAGADKAVRLWDTVTHRQIGTTFTGHTGSVRDVTFSPDGATIASASADGTARLWDVATHRQRGRSLANPFRRDEMTGVAFSPDGRRVVTAGDAVRLWDIARREAIGPAFPDDENSVSATKVAVSPDGKIVATGDVGGLTRLWDPVVHEQIGSAMSGVAGISMGPAGRILAVSGSRALAHAGAGGNDRTMRLWDVASGRQVGEALRPADRAPAGGGNANVFGIDFDPTGKVFATHNGPAGIRLWDAATHRQIGAPVRSGSAWGFTPDGKFLAILEFGSIRFLPITGGGGGQEQQSGQGEQGGQERQSGRNGPRIAAPGDVLTFTALAFSPDGTTAAAAAADHAVRLYDTTSGRQLGAPLPGAAGGSYDDNLAFSRDGRTLATTAEGRAVRLWDVRSHRQVGVPLVGHTGTVTALAFSPDGKVLATGAGDNTVRLWDLATDRQIGLPLIGHTGIVRSIVYRPDGKTIVTYADDETARLWNVAVPADPAATTCANAGRSLTPAEWRRYLPGEKFRLVCP